MDIRGLVLVNKLMLVNQITLFWTTIVQMFYIIMFLLKSDNTYIDKGSHDNVLNDNISNDEQSDINLHKVSVNEQSDIIFGLF